MTVNDGMMKTKLGPVRMAPGRAELLELVEVLGGALDVDAGQLAPRFEDGLNLLVLANNTALTRARSKEVVNPEDQKLNAGAAVVYEGGNEKTARYRRAHRNALENIPLFLITAYLLTATGVSTLTASILFGIFVAARLVHSFAYVNSLQPWRTLSFGLGALDQLAILGVLGYRVIISFS